ncbi:hypothetical protein J132_02726 [Termitomyces sp. J132]|nr:hypothetical protein J132_02726 [Termitomyces sp. J132]
MSATVYTLPIPLILLIHLHILVYPHANKPEYDHNIFDPRVRGLKERTKILEDVAYFLVGRLEGNARTILATYPCLVPSDTVAFRTSLSKYVEALRHSSIYPSTSKAPAGTTKSKGNAKEHAHTKTESDVGSGAWWWKDVVVRKSLLEECAGERFERLILSLSTHALFKASATNLNEPLCTHPNIYTALLTQSTYSRRTWAHSASTLLKREAELNSLKDHLITASSSPRSSKYTNIPTPRLIALVESTYAGLVSTRMHGAWAGERGKEALDFVIKAAGVEWPVPIRVQGVTADTLDGVKRANESEARRKVDMRAKAKAVRGSKKKMPQAFVLDLWEPESVGDSVDFETKPTPELLASFGLSLHASPDQDYKRDRGLEARIDEIRERMLTKYPETVDLGAPRIPHFEIEVKGEVDKEKEKEKRGYTDLKIPRGAPRRTVLTPTTSTSDAGRPRGVGTTKNDNENKNKNVELRTGVEKRKGDMGYEQGQKQKQSTRKSIRVSLVACAQRRPELFAPTPSHHQDADKDEDVYEMIHSIADTSTEHECGADDDGPLINTNANNNIQEKNKNKDAVPPNAKKVKVNRIFTGSRTRTQTHGARPPKESFLGVFGEPVVSLPSLDGHGFKEVSGGEEGGCRESRDGDGDGEGEYAGDEGSMTLRDILLSADLTGFALLDEGEYLVGGEVGGEDGDGSFEWEQRYEEELEQALHARNVAQSRLQKVRDQLRGAETERDEYREVVLRLITKGALFCLISPAEHVNQSGRLRLVERSHGDFKHWPYSKLQLSNHVDLLREQCIVDDPRSEHASQCADGLVHFLKRELYHERKAHALTRARVNILSAQVASRDAALEERVQHAGSPFAPSTSGIHVHGKGKGKSNIPPDLDSSEISALYDQTTAKNRILEQEILSLFRYVETLQRATGPVQRPTSPTSSSQAIHLSNDHPAYPVPSSSTIEFDRHPSQPALLTTSPKSSRQSSHLSHVSPSPHRGRLLYTPDQPLAITSKSQSRTRSQSHDHISTPRSSSLTASPPANIVQDLTEQVRLLSIQIDGLRTERVALSRVIQSQREEVTVTPDLLRRDSSFDSSDTDEDQPFVVNAETDVEHGRAVVLEEHPNDVPLGHDIGFDAVGDGRSDGDVTEGGERSMEIATPLISTLVTFPDPSSEGQDAAEMRGEPEMEEDEGDGQIKMVRPPRGASVSPPPA